LLLLYACFGDAAFTEALPVISHWASLLLSYLLNVPIIFLTVLLADQCNDDFDVAKHHFFLLKLNFFLLRYAHSFFATRLGYCSCL
jgi:hypothetical protein